MELQEVVEERLEVGHVPGAYKVDQVWTKCRHITNVEGSLDGIAADDAHVFVGPGRCDGELKRQGVQRRGVIAQ